MVKEILVLICAFIIGFSLYSGPKLNRMDDGTRCYTHFFTMECNFELINERTNYGMYPLVYDSTTDIEEEL